MDGGGRWSDIERVFHAALECEPERRDEFLRTECGPDEELRRRVQSLLAHDGSSSDALPALPPDAELPPPEIEHPFHSGNVLEGRFRIVREVARGGMGIVYEAFDQKLDRRIAIKCAQAGYHTRLPREVRNASDVSHPNVCKLFEIHTAPTPHGEVEFITMEYLEGETLAERLRRGPVPHQEARSIALQLCAGLAEAHRDNVIHGDLKSGNVILTKAADGAERAVITDFGLACRPRSSAQMAFSATRGGTPDYMAPELWRGAKASVASDIYALGVILYELAAGRRPNQAPPDSAASTLTMPKSLEGRLARKPAPVGPKWDRILARCLDPDPARRFQSADEVARALAPHSRRWFLSAAAAIVLALGASVLTYQRATAPAETVRLAALPFTAPPELRGAADRVARDAASSIARLKGNSRTRLIAIPATGKPTHSLRGTLEGGGDKLTLHVYVTDARTNIDAKDWKADYAPKELRYAGAALAGVVSETFHIPPLPATVNAAAQRGYQEGIQHLRVDTEVDAAIAALERAVAADPDSPLPLAELSRAQWLKYSITAQKPFLDSAGEALRQATLRSPDRPQVHIMAGVLKAHDGWYEQAATEFRRTIEIDPKNGDAYRRLAGVYERNNQLAEALAALRQAVEVDPGNYRNHQKLGAFLFNKLDYAEAIKHFKRTVELVPNLPRPHFALGTSLMSLGRFPEAERELRLSIGLGATPEALDSLGLVLIYERMDREAVPYLRQALILDPHQYANWSHLATAYRHLGLRVEEKRANVRALELTGRELARNPRSGDVRSQLAYLYACLGDRGRAESEIAQALQQSPANSATRWMAVMTYEVLGQRDNALAALNSASPEFLADLARWPDGAALQRDPRFLSLVADRQVK